MKSCYRFGNNFTKNNDDKCKYAYANADNYVYIKICWAKTVVREEAAILTILLPIKTVLSIFLELLSTLSSTIAFLFPSSTSILNLTLLNVVRAVSADEKNAENNNKTNNMHSRAMSLGPI